jgi:hypothetical protein
VATGRGRFGVAVAETTKCATRQNGSTPSTRRDTIGEVVIRKDVQCRTVPAPGVDGRVVVDLAGEEAVVTVPEGVSIERR